MVLSKADIAEHLGSLSFIPRFQSLVKSSEGGEHIVWAIDDAFILRMPIEDTNNLTLEKEKQLHDLLSKHNSAIPKCIHIGRIGSYAYAIYEKVKGNSIESAPENVNRTTEADLASLLLSLKQIPPTQVTALGFPYAQDLDLTKLQDQALSAWKKMTANQQIEDETDIETALSLPPDAPHQPVVLHADFKGEHIFIDARGHITGVIDWSDTQVGHPSTDIGGLAISIGALATSRVAHQAGYSEQAIRRGIFSARCRLISLLDEVLNEGDDSPEWLVRRQVKRALETEADA